MQAKIAKARALAGDLQLCQAAGGDQRHRHLATRRIADDIARHQSGGEQRVEMAMDGRNHGGAGGHPHDLRGRAEGSRHRHLRQQGLGRSAVDQGHLALGAQIDVQGYPAKQRQIRIAGQQQKAGQHGGDVRGRQIGEARGFGQPFVLKAA